MGKRMLVIGGKLNKGVYWNISVRRLIEDYLVMVKCLEEHGVPVEEVEVYMDEFEHQDGYIRPATRRRFIRAIKLMKL